MDAKMMERANLGIVVVQAVVNLHLAKMLRTMSGQTCPPPGGQLAQPRRLPGLYMQTMQEGIPTGSAKCPREG